MQTCPLSLSAYKLRKTWEQEDKKIFGRFKKDERALQVINALAEILVRLESGKSEEINFHC